jgi:hypothetical protein
MFQPLSRLRYVLCKPKEQILVCTLALPPEGAVLKWAGRAAAIFALHQESQLNDLLRDVLANPRIRALCIDGEGAMRSVVESVWTTTKPPQCPINDEHLTLVRQFVDLFDGDCALTVPLSPFWPEPIRYE